MSVVPRKLLEKIQWCENHVATWTANSVAMGSTAAEVTAFEAKTEATRAALAAAEVARDAAKDATLTLHTAVEALDVAAAGVIKQVRAKAETTNNPGVYALASIPAPATPTPVGAPGTPNTLKVSLKPMGQIELTWKCANPSGCHNVIYQVYRKVESTGEYTYLGGSGARKFVDATVPAGVPSVMYQIQGTRSTAVGDAAEFVVNFGVGSGGGITASVAAAGGGGATGTPARIAA